MPLYEYKCSACGYQFEVIQKFSDQPDQICPRCNHQSERLLSAPAIQFKGSGWYITDYAKKNSPAPTPAEKSDKGKEEKKSIDSPSNNNTPT